MNNTREKLIDLVRDALNSVSWDWGDYPDVDAVVDILIANGVTLDNQVSSSKWIPVTDEQKPKDRRNYFIAYVFDDSDMHFFGEAKYYAYDGNGIVDRPHFSNEGVEGMRVTHWMEIPKLPLPEPPKEG